MPEVTASELSRYLDRLEKRQETHEGKIDRRFNDVVSKAVYEANITELRQDIGEIKDSQRWAMRLIVAQFVALVVGMILFLLANTA